MYAYLWVGVHMYTLNYVFCDNYRSWFNGINDTDVLIALFKKPIINTF